jgi:hypothetical protein
MPRRSIWLVMAVAAVVPAFGNTVTTADADIQTALSTGFSLVGYNVSNTGASLITGSVGVGSSAGKITGFDPIGSATGAVYAPGGPTAAAAYNDFVTAYIAALGLAGGTPIAAGLPSQVFTAAEGVNVYTLPAGGTSTTTGTHLTFNANGNPNAVFIIQVPGAFTVNGSMTFSLVNGAKADNIIWVVGNAATINVGSSGPITFDGNILAGSTFTMSVSPDGIGTLTGTINGCVFSDKGTNTLAGKTDVQGCSGNISVEKDPAFDPVPESGTMGFFACSLVGLGLLIRRPVCRS